MRATDLLRRGTIVCADVVQYLPGVAEGEVLADPRHRDHVESCLRCRAELVQYRKMLRSLRLLRSRVIEPAPGFLADVLGAVHLAGEEQAVRSLTRGRRLQYAVGIGAASAAAATGMLVVGLRGRGRRIATVDR